MCITLYRFDINIIVSIRIDICCFFEEMYIDNFLFPCENYESLLSWQIISIIGLRRNSAEY